jgi:fatty acid-binding protein DegV
MSINGIEGNRSYASHGEIGEPPDSNDGAQLATEEAPGASLLLLEGDISAQVTALAILSAQKQRNANRDLQTMEEAAIERAEAEQVKAMHEQADDIRMAGMVEGGFGAISGGFKLAGALSVSDGDSQLFAAEAATSDAFGKGFAAIPKGEEADDKANAEAHSHAAGHHRRAYDAARDSAREGQDLLGRALDFYKQSQQGAADARNASVRRG